MDNDFLEEVLKREKFNKSELSGALPYNYFEIF